MQIEITGRPAFGMAIVQLNPGDQISAEAGAMVAMGSRLSVTTGFLGGRGGVLRWLKAAITGLLRRWLAGESLFVNTYEATDGGGEVLLAPVVVGDVEHLRLDDTARVYLKASAYLASSPGVSVTVRWGGLSMWFGGEGRFFLLCYGAGDLLFNAFGALERIEIDGSYIVDTGHVIAWQGDLSYALEGAGGLWSTLFSGEGVVIRFEGQGTVWLQTRNQPAFIDWITPYFPK
ncbi:MAG TPA: TIGR00266 family protein [Deltaproteobacteria bacterium]|nr:TIGR00266 family protein [Deltaproteobacteria bacterium]